MSIAAVLDGAGLGPVRSGRPLPLHPAGSVRVADGLSAPRRSKAIAALCDELNATETLYPATNLRLIYSVKGY